MLFRSNTVSLSVCSLIYSFFVSFFRYDLIRYLLLTFLLAQFFLLNLLPSINLSSILLSIHEYFLSDSRVNAIYNGFAAKTKLIKYYEDVLSVEFIGVGNRMILEGEKFLEFFEKYYGKKLNNETLKNISEYEVLDELIYK